MSHTGAHPPRRAGLARIAEATSRARETIRETRAMSRERREALAFFHDDLRLRPGASVQDVLDAVTALRGREVVPVAISSLLKPIASGVSVLGSEAHGVDYVGVINRASRKHQAHVLLHEVRHLCPGGGDWTETHTTSSIAVHTGFDSVTLASLRDEMSALPEDVREDILNRPAKLRARYDTGEERTCEVFARVVLPLLDLDDTSQRTGSLTSAFSNRRYL
ncbi:hypothetical protein [Streptomyces olivaceus]|uniref:hypothetical protein n=1 Tax=Streptomyces olivaceus TaxID=47716 RepID=UPI00248F5067|nr:hypothetical protein [Streptomyces olivaceus]